jgi:hypothetical protein
MSGLELLVELLDCNRRTTIFDPHVRPYRSGMMGEPLTTATAILQRSLSSSTFWTGDKPDCSRRSAVSFAGPALNANR